MGKGTWMICAPPCGWAIYNASPYQNDPDRYHEKGVCFLCMFLPVPSNEVWSRQGAATTSTRTTTTATLSPSAALRTEMRNASSTSAKSARADGDKNDVLSCTHTHTHRVRISWHL